LKTKTNKKNKKQKQKTKNKKIRGVNGRNGTILYIIRHYKALEIRNSLYTLKTEMILILN